MLSLNQRDFLAVCDVIDLSRLENTKQILKKEMIVLQNWIRWNDDWWKVQFEFIFSVLSNIVEWKWNYTACVVCEDMRLNGKASCIHMTMWENHKHLFCSELLRLHISSHIFYLCRKHNRRSIKCIFPWFIVALEITTFCVDFAAFFPIHHMHGIQVRVVRFCPILVCIAIHIFIVLIFFCRFG